VCAKVSENGNNTKSLEQLANVCDVVLVVKLEDIISTLSPSLPCSLHPYLNLLDAVDDPHAAGGGGARSERERSDFILVCLLDMCLSKRVACMKE